MILQVILEGLGLGVLLVLICAAGIRKGAVGMVHLYSPAVQQRCVKLGLTSPERIRRNSLLFKAVCNPVVPDPCEEAEKAADRRVFPITVLSSLPPAPSL